MELMTPKELEEAYPVLNRRFQRELRLKRRIPFIRLGHRTVAYRRRDVERFLSSHCVEAMPAGNGCGAVAGGSR